MLVSSLSLATREPHALRDLRRRRPLHGALVLRAGRGEVRGRRRGVESCGEILLLRLPLAESVGDVGGKVRHLLRELVEGPQVGRVSPRVHHTARSCSRTFLYHSHALGPSSSSCTCGSSCGAPGSHSHVIRRQDFAPDALAQGPVQLGLTKAERREHEGPGETRLL